MNTFRIRTKIEDYDDDDGRERKIPIGMIGIVQASADNVTKADNDTLFDILWENGGWTRWTANELRRDADWRIEEL